MSAEELNEEQEETMRSCIGKLSWLANQTMPQIAFTILELTTKSTWTGADVRALLKATRCLEPISIGYRNLNWDRARLEVYTDASLGNLEGSKSGAGHIIFLTDGSVKNLIAYSCAKVKRVVKSVFAAELYSLSEGLSEVILIRHFIQEITNRVIPISVWTDSRQVFDAVTKVSSQPRDKKTILELREVQDWINREQVDLQWIPSKENPADALTKKGVSPDGIVSLLR